MIVGACAVIVIAGLRAGREIVAPTLLALLVAVSVLPLIHWLERKKLPNRAAILIVVLGGFLIGAAVIIFVSISFGKLATHLPAYEADFASHSGVLAARLERLGILVPSTAGFFNISRFFGVLEGLLSVTFNALDFASLSLLLFIVFSIEAAHVSGHVRHRLGRESRAEARFVTLGESISGYFRVRSVNNLFMAVALTILLLAFRVEYAGLWGVLAFFLAFIPGIGLTLSVLPAALLAWIQHGWIIASLVVAGAIVISVLGDNVLTPRLAGKALNMSLATIFLAFIFWAWVFGLLGALMSVPLTAIIMVALDSYDETRWVANLMSARGITPSPEKGVTEKMDDDKASSGPDDQ